MMLKKNAGLILAILCAFSIGGCTKNNFSKQALKENSNFIPAATYENLGCATEVKVNTKVSAAVISSIKKYAPLSKNKITASMIRGTGGFPSLARANCTDVFIHGFKSEKKVALTFDDGPDSNLTPKLLDILKKYNVKVSFFVIGSRVDNAPEVLKREVEEGHVVLNHSFSHPEFKKMDSNAIKKEILDNEDKIYSAIGLRTAIVRPPYGSVDQRVANTIKDLGYKTALWSIDTLDWQNRNKDKIIANVMNSVKPEDIILMHMNEDKTATLEAVPELIEKLRSKGYSFTTLDEMLEVNAYK